jgi:acyl-ACP thioesterase
MEIYSENYRLKSRDVDRFRSLRMSALFEIMQETATEHSELLGSGIDVIRAKNLMWVLALQLVEIERMPKYREEIRIETWPGRTVHSLYPRYHCILDAEGNCIIRSSAIWTLADVLERKLVPSAQSGFDYAGVKTGKEIFLPRPPRSFFTNESMPFTVPLSYIDMNGHMNNTRYFDLAENVFSPAKDGRSPSRILVEYASELRLGETYDISWGEKDGHCYLMGGGEKPSFRIVVDY